MSEEAAAWAVLGTGIDELGVAITRHWGLDGAVQQMARRLPLSAAVRTPDSDDDMLRLSASCAIEAVDALAQPAAQVVPALQRVLQRYARPLSLTLKDLQQALDLQPAAAEDARQKVSQ
jgi:non-specific serine/threonine protein kinase